LSERKIRGNIVCHCRDAYGEIVITDDGPTRSLYVGDGILQSSILPAQPSTLIEDYHQAMMSALLFIHAPRSVLLVGLGGCSMVHFLLTAFPSCRIDVVEIRQQVIELAYDFFLLPRENTRLNIFHTAGEEQQDVGCSDYDLIIIDAFDNEGPASALLEMPFLTACRKRLNVDGVCTLNLWNRPKDNFPALYSSIREVFENHTLKLAPAEDYWNVIVFGFSGLPPSAELPSCRRAARRLQQAYALNFPKYLSYLCWQNFS
jgi:spermidine synthase